MQTSFTSFFLIPRAFDFFFFGGGSGNPSFPGEEPTSLPHSHYLDLLHFYSLLPKSILLALPPYWQSLFMLKGKPVIYCYVTNYPKIY